MKPKSKLALHKKMLPTGFSEVSLYNLSSCLNSSIIYTYLALLCRFVDITCLTCFINWPYPGLVAGYSSIKLKPWTYTFTTVKQENSFLYQITERGSLSRGKPCLWSSNGAWRELTPPITGENIASAINATSIERTMLKRSLNFIKKNENN